ncbi:MAG TPA: YggS family pyridoxal phosphate-dependent enzyme [Gaiellales bacterium]|nr:YggS family pyridoxal phosphate-dependent enzyme [Gaiellales bacterium]
MLDAAVVARNLARVREAVGPGVEILAATKYVEAGDLPALREGGVTLVGENRTDALLEKQERFGDTFTWDFIGHVQSRKVRDLIGRVRLVHALDSLSAAGQMQSRAAEPVDCLLQVNVAGEDTKSGVPVTEVDAFLDELAPLDRVRLRGLMTMPPLTDDPEEARPWFSALRELRDRLRPRWAGRHDLDHLSMGTSQDYAVAAAEGATIVRVGTVLYRG